MNRAFNFSDRTFIGSDDYYAAELAVVLLKHGDCGLADGSLAGDWKMPNELDLQGMAEVLLNCVDNHACTGAIGLTDMSGTSDWTQGDLFIEDHNFSFLNCNDPDYWTDCVAFWTSAATPPPEEVAIFTVSPPSVTAWYKLEVGLTIWPVRDN